MTCCEIWFLTLFKLLQLVTTIKHESGKEDKASKKQMVLQRKEL
jgi:hypothetical protein